MTIEQIKAVGTKSEAQSILGALKRIETKLDTVITNQAVSGGGSGGSGGTTGGDDDSDPEVEDT